MTNIKNILLALLIGLVAGLCAGYYAKGKFTQADQVEAVIEQRKENVTTAKEMRSNEADLQAEIRSSRRTVEVIRSEVKKHEIAAPQVKDQSQAPVDCRAAVLGDDLAGLLNSARAGTTPAAASGRDGDGATTAGTEAERNRQ